MNSTTQSFLTSPNAAGTVTHTRQFFGKISNDAHLLTLHDDVQRDRFANDTNALTIDTVLEALLGLLNSLRMHAGKR